MLALCTCGIDMTYHRFEDDDWSAKVEHEFIAAGTKYTCDEFLGTYYCPRPRYHLEEGVDHGPLTGNYLWT